MAEIPPSLPSQAIGCLRLLFIAIAKQVVKESLLQLCASLTATACSFLLLLGMKAFPGYVPKMEAAYLRQLIIGCFILQLRAGEKKEPTAI